jgi:tetratricopeptide (TPR) repeat protein
LRLFNQFLHNSDLDAAQQCVGIYESMLANFHAGAPTRCSGSTAFPGEIDNVGSPAGCQKQYHVLIQLARTLEERYQYTGDARDLKSAAKYGEEALAMSCADNTVCPTVGVFYADILGSVFETTTNWEKLRMAEVLCREAMMLCEDAHPLSSTACHSFSGIYLKRLLQSGDQAIIDKAANLQRMGLRRLPKTESYNKHRHLRRLAEILAQSPVQEGDQNEDGILFVISEAFRLCPSMHVDRLVIHTRMMEQLLAEYIRSGELAFLKRAIELGRQALDMGISPNTSRRANLLLWTADSLRTRYVRAGTDADDLEESVRLYREALQINFATDEKHWAYLNGLAWALVLQFRSDGDISHLEEVAQLYHNASAVISTANPRKYYTNSGYAHSLGLCFVDTGDISELNRAICLDKEAIAAIHPSTVDYTHATVQVISHLCLRFEMLHESSDLRRAIVAAEELLESIPEGHMNRLEAINVLAKTRLLYAIDQNDSGGIDLAIEQLLSVKNQLSRSHLGPESLRTLAACYMVKFRHAPTVDTALRARDVIDEALESVSSNHYERFQCLINAAKLYLEPGTPYCHIDIALKYLSDALKSTQRDVRSKIRGVKDVLIKLEIEYRDVLAAASTSSQLLDITEFVVQLLPRIAFFGAHPYSRLQSLKQGQAIAMTGASHALNLYQPAKALEIMEQSRAIFWTHILRLRSPLDDLPDDLQGRLFKLARRLENAANAYENSTDREYIDRQIAQRRQDTNEFNSLVGQVRCLPGLERFMLPDEYATLKRVAEKGPVAVLVSSTLACHAIILKSSGDAVSIPLEAVTDKWVMESASVWRSTVIETRSALRDGRKLVKSKKVPSSPYTRAERILRLLWTNVVFPVIQALRIEVRWTVLPL